MPTYGDAAANPPEVNYWTLMAGDHGASAAASAVAQQTLADVLASQIAVLEGGAASTAAGGWQGLGSTGMVAHASGLSGVMGMAVAWLQQGSITAMQIVDAYTLAMDSMIPGPVCTENRVTQSGLIATNWFNQNIGPIIGLEVQYTEHFWVQNASLTSTYQSVVTAALGVLSTPPPFAPNLANPAGPLAGVVQAGAGVAANSLQSGFQAVSQTASTAAPAAQAPAAMASQGLSSMMGMPMQMAGQMGQIFGQAPQMLGQVPQMLSQAVQLPMGLLGQLSSAGNLTGAEGDAVDSDLMSSTGGAPVGAAFTSGAGGGIGGGGSGVVPSTYTRPASSFNTPNQPRLPGGFGAAAAPEPLPVNATGMGGNGLYGAPPMAGRDAAGSSSERAPGRTMQLAARPEFDGGSRNRN
ncbi:PPE domain-containing protein [Mycobacterium sp. 236(2023)]|uniref:PPE domain-containing protein n=1 Tax=Mycobacterium sp. 236(2023) TaxID=3038163 RepID=UPI00241586B4|nr:PPE domain-containing protein [Mycobacterium sp. 236(2023)]MDG4667960.1 PPE domain-containing protein [Mycobacterium sp. 236(2023)]